MEKIVTVNDLTINKITTLLNSKLYTKLEQIHFLKTVFKDPDHFDLFCKFCFPDTFTKPFASCHYDMFKFLFNKDNGVIALPRGHGKSSICVTYIIWYICNKQGKYIVYMSQNHRKSISFIEPIKKELSTNPILSFIYGDLKIGASKDESGKDREDIFDINYKIRVEALSFEKNIRGLKYGNYRPSLIILDDIEDDQRVLNPELRAKDRDKVDKEILPAIDIETGKYKMVGTILHAESLLMNKLRLYSGKILKAIDEKGRPVFFNKIQLDRLKKEMGSLKFQQEYMNEPVADENCLIRPEWVRGCFNDNLSYSDKYNIDNCDIITSGMDCAFSDSILADNTAIAVIGQNKQTSSEDKKGKYLVLFAEWIHGQSITRQMQRLSDINKKYPIYMNGIEENSVKAVSAEFETKLDFNYKLFWLGTTDEKAKLKPATDFPERRVTIGKISLVMRLATRFENKEVYLPYKTEEDKIITNRMFDELTSWGLADGKLVERGIHPDMPIALAYAFELQERNKVVIDF